MKVSACSTHPFGARARKARPLALGVLVLSGLTAGEPLDRPDLHERLGRSALRSGLYTDAAGYLQKAIGKRPWRRDLRHVYATALFAQGDYARGASAIRSAVTRQDDIDAIPLDLTGLFASPVEMDRSHARLLYHLLSHPTDEDALLVQGYVAYGRNDRPSARRTFARLAERPGAYRAIARFFLERVGPLRAPDEGTIGEGLRALKAGRYREACRMILGAGIRDADSHFILVDALLAAGEIEAAAREVRHAASVAPPGASLSGDLLDRLRAKEDIDRARRALQERPSSPDTSILLGYLETRLGNPASARPYLERIPGADKDPAAHFLLGLGRGDPAGDLEEILVQRVRGPLPAPSPDRALRIPSEPRGEPPGEEQRARFGEILAKDPRNVEALYGMARSLEAGPDRQAPDADREARRLYERVTSLDPGHARAFNHLGLILLRTGDEASAFRAFQEAILTMPDLAPAWNNIGTLHESDGRDPIAEDHYRRSVEIDPTLAEARLNLARVLYKRGDFAEAEKVVREVIAAKPAGILPHAHDLLGKIYHAQARFDVAEAEYRKAIELDPTSAGLENDLAILLGNLGRADEAIRILDGILSKKPDGRALTNRGNARAARADLAGAEEDYRKASEVDPELPEPAFNLAVLAEIRGDDARAASLYRTAVQKDPRHVPSLLALGVLHLRAGRHEEALGSAEKADALGAMDPNIRLLGALAQHRLGRRKESLASIETFLQIAPPDDPARGKAEVLRTELKEQGK